MNTSENDKRKKDNTMASLNINENGIREISCVKEISAVVISSRCKISLSQTETSDTAGKELTGYVT